MIVPFNWWMEAKALLFVTVRRVGTEARINGFRYPLRDLTSQNQFSSPPVFFWVCQQYEFDRESNPRPSPHRDTDASPTIVRALPCWLWILSGIRLGKHPWWMVTSLVDFPADRGRRNIHQGELRSHYSLQILLKYRPHCAWLQSAQLP